MASSLLYQRYPCSYARYLIPCVPNAGHGKKDHLHPLSPGKEAWLAHKLTTITSGATTSWRQSWVVSNRKSDWFLWCEKAHCLRWNAGQSWSWWSTWCRTSSRSCCSCPRWGGNWRATPRPWVLATVTTSWKGRSIDPSLLCHRLRAFACSFWTSWPSLWCF